MKKTSTKTYADLVQQINSLSREAEELKRKERAGVIARIKEAIATYGLTASDLGLSGARGGKTAATRGGAASRKGRRRTAKFRDDAGNTWGGRGPRPRWLRDALAAGKRLEDFAIN